MCEITSRNFGEIFLEKNVEKVPLYWDICSASFISIDCEFSGIFDDLVKCTLFDSPETRFKKLQVSLADFAIIQFGLSTFNYNSSTNTYTVSTYNFYLKPLPGLGAYYPFSFHPGSVQFHCKNNFDFNKLFYEGINYARIYDEQRVKAKIKDDKESYAEDIHKYCSQVSSWLINAKEDSEMFLKLKDKDSTFVWVLYIEIRKRFHNVWTYFEEEKVVKIRKITHLERSLLSDRIEEISVLEAEMFKYLMGFTEVIRMISVLKKPIVGHNILLDLIMIYKQFYNPRPVSYKSFKAAILEIFPVLFDTKHISFALREFLSREKTWNSNSLSDLYNYFKHGKGATEVILTPLVNHTNDNFIQETHFHDAGFDSYCTGYCFLKMAHMFCLMEPGRNFFFRLTSMQPTNTWLMASVDHLRNKVNMARGQVDYIVLDGRDPRSSRPGPLYIQSKTSSPLDISKVTEKIAKYASVDIKPLTKYKALMAVSNQRQVREILELFKCDKEVKVTKYSFLKHSAPEKVLKAALVATMILVAAYLARGRRT